MKSLTFLLFAAIGLMIAGTPQNLLAADPGEDIFLSKKCNKCHTIDAKGIAKAEKKGDDDDDDDKGDDADEGGKKKATDLSGAGVEHDAAWITKWLKKEVEKEKKDGKKIKHKKKWKGSDEDLKTLTEWLATLKTPAKGN